MIIEPKRPSIVIQTRRGSPIPCEPQLLPMSREEVERCRIVVYRYRNGRVEHTGIVAWVEENETVRLPWIVSKWGNLGEYIHRFNNSPYKGTAHFMRETPYDQP